MMNAISVAYVLRTCPLVPLVADGYNSNNTIRQVVTPLPVIHGDADELVPFPQGQVVFGSANPPKQFWRVRADITAICSMSDANNTFRHYGPFTNRWGEESVHVAFAELNRGCVHPTTLLGLAVRVGPGQITPEKSACVPPILGG